MWPFKKKQRDFPEIRDELLLLCREWFQFQIGDLPDDDLPPQEEIEADIVQMRDETFDRLISSVPADRFLQKSGIPDDEKNRRALAALVKAYAGHDRTTPIFTKLALAKVDEPRYRGGWALCTLRLIAETYLEQSVT